MVAEGNAFLEGKDFLIQSDKISFYKNDGIVQADKSVKITRPGMRLTAENAEYDFAKKQITSQDFRFGFSPLYVSGDEFFASGDLVEGNQATIHFNEPDGFEPNIKASKLYFNRLDQTAVVEDATFRIGSVPVFYLPNYSFVAGDLPYDPGVSLGYASHLGGYTKSSLWMKFDENVYAGGYLNFYSKRGFLLGPKLRYGKDEKYIQRLGEWSAGYIQDWNEPGIDRYGLLVDQERFFIKGFHKENIKDGIDLVAQFDWRDDSEIFRDFDYGYFKNNQDADTFIETSFQAENTVASLFGRFRPNYYEPVIERLPELTYSLLPMPIYETGFVQRGETQFTYLRQESTLSNLGQVKSKRANFYYQLSRPFQYEDWFSFTPLVGGQFSHYFYTRDQSNGYSRFVGEAGFDLSAKSYAVWNIEKPVWGISGIRHIAKPIVQYRYEPGLKNGKGKIPELDKSIRLTRIDPLGLGDNPSIDDIRRVHKTRVGVENVLQTRHQEYGSRTLVAASVYQDFLHARNTDEKVLDSFYTDLEIMPASWISFDLLSRFKTEDLTMDSFSSGITLKDGDLHSLGFGTEMLNNEIEEYFVTTGFRLNEGLGLSSRVTYDARDNDFSELLGGIDTMLGRYWQLQSTLGYQENSESRGSWRIDMNVKLLSF